MKLKKEGNDYFIIEKKEFQGTLVNPIFVKQAFDFAYAMTYEGGFHRKNRSGGEAKRSDEEIFQNTFQGKTAEIILYELLKLRNIEVDLPDFAIHGSGKWDDVDLKANGKLICIKSATFFANLLLLETKDWDKEGNYIPNKNVDGATCVYDYFVLVRIKPDIKKMIVENSKDKEILWEEIKKTSWWFDIAGCCTIKTIRYMIENNYILPKDSLLNGKAKMDAENYYIQSGELQDLDFLCSGLIEN
ncbi:hypothetical protein GKZ90_0020065 [Flavobacterium sp. MC2016-06]|jgi:hypothetical protein|uniref:hypothetical protein n=1 Tax=Flavobacterium sp. MC2016-06 TaxID=2676308 RepID=UPI0012BA83B0|nr:hypothetical protein [Flavobacterium sp. MC2016-06]MBU3860889.1 hypothetical protein [Flavobacterium sp. MC2016-06]